MTVECGASRRVVKIGRYAVKTPGVKANMKTIVQRFKNGASCNRYEREVWRKYKDAEHLVPIVFADRWGIVVIMPWIVDDIDYKVAHEIKRWNSNDLMKLSKVGYEYNVGDVGGSNVVVSKGRLLIRDYGSNRY